MIIGSRYHGPPGSGNGGYTAGLIAAELGGDAIEVTLRKPPPLETELSLSHEPDGGVVLHDPSGERVAEAKRTVIASDEVVPAVSFATAVEASRTYQGFVRHPFPTCFVCGPQREPDDGLRVFPGRLADGRTAAPFIAPVDTSPVLIWAVLDCPGGWTVPQEERAHVLGRLAARVDALPAPGDQCVVMGLLLGRDGRKASVRTTLYSPTGTVLATARATWIEL